jgi:hypothetical protein
LFSHAITFTKDMGEGCHNPFLGHPKSFFLFLKKKKKKKLHGAVLNGTVQLFSPANAETREKKIFEIFFPLTLSFSTSPLA